MLNKKALNMLDFISPLNEGPNILHSAAILVKDIIEATEKSGRKHKIKKPLL